VIARPCHVYGPTITEADSRAFAQFIRNVINKEDIVLKSKGEQYRSYCYVADCTSALLTILLKGKNQNAYNISNKESSVSIAQFAEIISSIGRQKIIYKIPDEEEKKGYSVFSRAVLSPEKLEALGWNAKYSLVEGIQRTLNVLQGNNGPLS
jgi:nucleoside-diphosphate-sugar epimerase